MQTDSILIFAIAHAIEERPDLVQTDILKLMSRQIELEDENQELRRLLGRSEFTGIMPKDVSRNRASHSGRRRRKSVEPGNLIPGVGSTPKSPKALETLRGSSHLL